MQRWVFGVVNLDEPTKPIFACVQRRNAATLVPLIRRLIPAGSTIVSDEWRAYHRLGANGYLHLTVNHSQNFVDQRTGGLFAKPYCCCSALYTLLGTDCLSCTRMNIDYRYVFTQEPTRIQWKALGATPSGTCGTKTPRTPSPSKNGYMSTCGENGVEKAGPAESSQDS